MEEDGTLHTKERCQQVKSKQAKEITLEQVLRKLETHGIIINIERLMKRELSGPVLFVVKLCKNSAWLFHM